MNRSLQENIEKWMASNSVLDAITVVHQHKVQQRKAGLQRRVLDVGFLVALGALAVKYVLLLLKGRKMEVKVDQTYIQYPLTSG